MTDMQDLKKRMEGTIGSFQHDLSGLRTGRASVALLDGVQVEAYGNFMPINQVGSISTPEPRLLTVQVWDKGMVGAVEKAIRNANLGLNPASDGQLVRVPMPEMSEERRKEMVKIAHKHAEEARVRVRNIRRDGMDASKKKDSGLSEDDIRKVGEDIQKLTDDYIKKIDDLLKVKEQDILKV